jgi:hypothetical protein
MKYLLRIAQTVSRQIFTLENLAAVLICILLIILVILTSDQSPQWIYQGF